MGSFEIVLGLVVLATVIAALAGRLSAPAPSLLVLAGLGIGAVPGLSPGRLSPEIVGLVVLPPLLFAAGQDLSVRDLRLVWRPVTILAVGLVVATAAAVAGVATVLVGLPLPVGFVLGAVLASTDPVAVTALARTLRLPPRLEALVAAESLFNDATSLLMFKVAVGVVMVGGVAWDGVALQLVQLGGGGVLVGGLVAFGVAAVRRRTHDPVLETVITLVTPYAAYVLAEAVHVSGVTAVVVTGVTVGALSPRLTSAFNRLQVTAVTGTVVFLLESVVFALIGLQLPELVRALDVSARSWLLPAVVVMVTVLVMRALWAFPVALMLPGDAASRIPAGPTAAVMTWAGTRGVVPLAAALSIPLALPDGRPFPDRDLLLVLAISVCVLTLVVQGLSLGPLTRLSGVAEPPEVAQRERALAEFALADAALARARALIEVDHAPAADLSWLVDSLLARRGRAEHSLRHLDGPHHLDGGRDLDGAGVAQSGGPHERGGKSGGTAGRADVQALRQDILGAERDALTRLLADSEIGEGTWRRLQRSLDLEEAALNTKGL